jgi:ADP-dependent phosphofructokinase/glucokinase
MKKKLLAPKVFINQKHLKIHLEVNKIQHYNSKQAVSSTVIFKRFKNIGMSKRQVAA